MGALAIILIVLVVIVVVLAIGGAVAAQRRSEADEAKRRELIEQANEQLAHAHAEDRGWERATMEAAARAAVVSSLGDVEIEELHLVQVIDRPGTDSDEAIFEVRTADGTHPIRLGRRDGDWVPG